MTWPRQQLVFDIYLRLEALPQISEEPHSMGTISVLSLSFAKLAFYAMKANSRANLLHSHPSSTTYKLIFL